MDALTFAHAADGFTIDYSYLWNVNRVFKGSRSSVQESDFDSNSHALVAGRRTNLGNFSGFLYAYDFDNAAATSSISYGASYTGTFDALTVAATYARQRDHADNPQPYDADYLMLEVSAPSPDRAVVFQNHALLPWLTVYENVELAMQPKVLLMDEPFGALDALTRAHLQDSLMEIHAELGTTVVMITHDVDEAVLPSDRIVMMSNGPAATIGEILAVNLPRPRHRVALAEDPAFMQARQQVLQFLYDRHGYPDARAA